MLINQRQQLINQFLALEFPADEAALLADAELRKHQASRLPTKPAQKSAIGTCDMPEEVLA